MREPQSPLRETFAETRFCWGVLKYTVRRMKTGSEIQMLIGEFRHPNLRNADVSSRPLTSLDYNHASIFLSEFKINGSGMLLKKSK